MTSTCSEVGFPLELDKVDRPTTRLTFIGFELDTATPQIRLPLEKPKRLQTLITDWRRNDKRSCKRRELESLAGQLHHAAAVVRPGRAFLWSIYELLHKHRHNHHNLQLNSQMRADLEWWHRFSRPWNGMSMLFHRKCASSEVEFSSDASGSWGAAAYWEPRWFQVEWCHFPKAGSLNIATKELLPIVIASILWGKFWTGTYVLCHCDNQAVVNIVNNRYSRDPDMMHMIRTLFFISAHYHFELVSRHIPGSVNQVADTLSRNMLSRFLSLKPQADRQATPVEAQVVNGLLAQMNWTSPEWTSWFTSILRMP